MCSMRNRSRSELGQPPNTVLILLVMKRITAGFIFLALATALLGCKREAASDDAQAAATTPTVVSAKTPQSNAELKRMVSGVSAAKDESIIELKFELKDRPQLDQPLDIAIALLPKVPATTMRVTYSSADARALQATAEPAEYRDVQPGNIYRHELNVVPKENGAYYVIAVVLLDSDAGSISRTFAIPVVVGGPSDQPASVETKADTDSRQ
jgi:hypothetical protein